MQFLRLGVVLACFLPSMAKAEFKTLQVRAFTQIGLDGTESRSAYLTAKVVVSETGDDTHVYLSVGETPDAKTALNDVHSKIRTFSPLVRLSVLNLGNDGEVVLLSWTAGTRVRFRIYAVSKDYRPVLALKGVGDSEPGTIANFGGPGTFLCVTNHETGEFDKYFLTFYRPEGGIFKAAKCFEADRKTVFVLKDYVREVPVELVGRWNTPRSSRMPPQQK